MWKFSKVYQLLFGKLSCTFAHTNTHWFTWCRSLLKNLYDLRISFRKKILYFFFCLANVLRQSWLVINSKYVSTNFQFFLFVSTLVSTKVSQNTAKEEHFMNFLLSKYVHKRFAKVLSIACQTLRQFKKIQMTRMTLVVCDSDKKWRHSESINLCCFCCLMSLPNALFMTTILFRVSLLGRKNVLYI